MFLHIHNWETPSSVMLGVFLCREVLRTNKNQIDEVANTIKNKWGSIDVLINNAALDSPPDAPEEEVGPFENYPETSFDKVMNVNVKGTLLCCQIFGKIMATQKQGVIINISSVYGMGSPRQDIYNFRRKEGKTYFKPVAYSVSKSAILNFEKEFYAQS